YLAGNNVQKSHLPALFYYLLGNTSPEWIAFQEAGYRFFDHRTTWDQAQRICSWFDSSLASVHSAEEQAFLANTLSKVLQVF
uniref:C-type lectin domain-containing protein n=1 Tax=Xiphophorus couchianus TaxID=32473 RepID=A0A3B5MFP3_9TELE